MFQFRSRELAEKIVNRLEKLNLDIKIMHVCGTHQDTIVKHGMDTLFRRCRVQVRQGPGCPVCVTTSREFREAIFLAKKGSIIATFGDVSKAPSQIGSLLDQRSQGCDVRIVYSIDDAVNIAGKTSKHVVFMAVGFETTAPSTAATVLNGLPENFSILNCHRYMPPALHTLLRMGELRIDGLIEPGHVSTIIGLKSYEEIAKLYRIPQVVAGFEPLDVLMAVYMLAQQIINNEVKVENEYVRTVKYEGNIKALRFMEEVFEPFDITWRGFPVIPKSGMKLKKRFEAYDTRKIFEDELKEVSEELDDISGCRCGEVLRALIDPEDCPLFACKCTPDSPVGPCMVSTEGSCNIEYKYGGRRL